MKKFIPLSVPNLKGNEKKYVLDAIENEWVSTGGKYIDQFEEDIAEYLNVNGAVACQSGTAGLHLALILSDIKQDDEVIVPTLTFIAAVNPIKYIGASPIFMDCDDSLTIDCDKVEKFCLTECEFCNGVLINKNTQKKIKAIIVVHVFGNIANMKRIRELADKFNLKIIEDATEALGTYYVTGKYEGKFAGTIGDIGVYSFNGNKIITTGGGGMLVSNNLDTLKKAKYLSTQAKDDSLYYRHNEVGYNYRMTNVQAAIGIAQLEQLKKFIKIKKENYFTYKKGLENINGFDLVSFDKNIEANYWFYSLIIKNENISRDKIMEVLLSKGIQTRPIWGLIHEQKPYINCTNYNIEKAKYYEEHIINIPCSSNLSYKEIQFIISSLKELT